MAKGRNELLFLLSCSSEYERLSWQQWQASWHMTLWKQTAFRDSWILVCCGCFSLARLEMVGVSDKLHSSLGQQTLKKREDKWVWQWCQIKDYSWTYSILFLSIPQSVPPGHLLFFSSTISYAEELMEYTLSITQLMEK